MYKLPKEKKSQRIALILGLMLHFPIIFWCKPFPNDLGEMISVKIKKWCQLVPILLILLHLNSCVSHVRPLGTWATPVDLGLSNEALSGSVVEFRCLASDDIADFASTDGCRDIVKALMDLDLVVVCEESLLPQGVTERMMTVIQDARKVGVDFSLSYIIRPSERDFCGWTLLPALLTFTFFPCVESITARSELVIEDYKGHQVVRHELDANIRSTSGVWALYFLGLDQFLEGNYRPYRKKVLAGRLIQHVQNVVYSYDFNRKLSGVSKKTPPLIEDEKT
jgi:hypothetical protein